MLTTSETEIYLRRQEQRALPLKIALERHVSNLIKAITREE